VCTECDYAPECYACMVGVATGPESHSPCCPARGIPMPVQDGSFGPEWDEWERAVVSEGARALQPTDHEMPE
jgi:hypothetical protein